MLPVPAPEPKKPATDALLDNLKARPPYQPIVESDDLRGDLTELSLREARRLLQASRESGDVGTLSPQDLVRIASVLEKLGASAKAGADDLDADTLATRMTADELRITGAAFRNAESRPLGWIEETKKPSPVIAAAIVELEAARKKKPATSAK
jgi:hypothetical protein